MIAIVDLGIGNLSNVKRAVNGVITSDPDLIYKAEKIILPGVGSFSGVQERLAKVRKPILESIREGKPFLGICLGFQLLFEDSEEGEGEGLCVFKGKVKKLPVEKIPHIGWNMVFIRREGKLFKGIEDGKFFYFVHSFYVVPERREIVVSETEYLGFLFTSSIESENVFGIQFHPEKSSTLGIKILENFKKL